MKRSLAAVCALTVVGLLLAPGSASATRRTQRPTRPYAPSKHAPREVIVRYRSGASEAERTDARSSIAARVLDRLPLPDTQLVRVPAGTHVSEAVAELEADPDVLYAEPNYLVRAAATPNDPLWQSMWPLRNNASDADIDAPEAWDVTTGDSDVIVAVIDSGIAYDHPDLKDNIVAGWDFVDDDGTPFDLHGHGTHVAGTIGAQGNNSTGVTGVSWDVGLMPLRVLEVDGFGTSSDVAAAIVHARRNGADVVNASLGGPDYSRSIAAAISASPDMLFVAASGNDGQNIDTTPDYPCNFSLPNIVCVSATTDRDALASFSNYGAGNVDLAAPGSSILSAQPHFETFFRDRFEEDVEARWVSGGTNNTWGFQTDDYGGYVTDSPAGNYRDSTDAWLQLRDPVDLAGSNACLMTFSLDLQTQPNVDGLLAEASRDAGSWQRIGAYSGDTGDWRTVGADLGSLAGGPVYLRFRMMTDGAVTSEGVAIDDVQIDCATPRFTTRDYVTYSGTSMATPHVAGAAALLWAHRPQATALEIKQALLDGADRVAALDGKVADARRLSLYGALAAQAPDVPLPDPSDVPDLPVDPEPSEDPTPTSSPSPTPSATPSASPSASPTPAPSGPPTGITHPRSVSLKLSKHLIAAGRITTSGDSACLSQPQWIKITRNGKVVKRIAPSADGTFRVRLPDRRGRYQIDAPRVGLPSGDACARARSPQRTHRH